MTRTEVTRIREALDMTQVEFAELLGYTQATVSRWESGDVRVYPRLAELIRLKTGPLLATRPVAV